MNRELEAVALAVAHADPRFIPVQVRRAYDRGATVNQVLAAIETGRCPGDVPAAMGGSASTMCLNTVQWLGTIPLEFT